MKIKYKVILEDKNILKDIPHTYNNGYLIFDEQYEEDIKELLKHYKYQKVSLVKNKIKANLYRYEWKIYNLDCANCAMKLEKHLKEKFQLISCEIDFMNGLIKIINSKKVNIDDVSIAADNFESGVYILENKRHLTFSLKGNKEDVRHLCHILNKEIHCQAALMNLIIYEDGNSLKFIQMINKCIKDNKLKIRLVNDKKENNQLFYRFIISLIIVTCAFFVEMDLLNLFLMIVAYIILAYDIIFKALKNVLKSKFLDENFLMFIASVGAFIINLRTEALAIMIFYQIGEFLQDKAVQKSRKIVDSIEFKVHDICVIKDEKMQYMRPEDVKVGSVIVVKKGEVVALDGKILDKSSSFNMAQITGESRPVLLSKGDDVLSGSINLGDITYIEVSKNYESSMMFKISEMIKKATNDKPKSEQFIKIFAKYYTPTMIILALALLIIFPILKIQNINQAFYSAINLLVISCPCALVISIPLINFMTITNMYKKKIIIKNSQKIEELNYIDTVVFDKTGTLTTGSFLINDINIFAKYTKQEVLDLACGLEKYSNHPIAKAFTKEKHNDLLFSNVKELEGVGISGNFNNKKYQIGNYQLKNGLKDEGLYLLEDDLLIAQFIITDEIKQDCFKLIDDLNQSKYDTIMLSGDNQKACDDVKDKLNLKLAYSRLLPDDKLEIAKKMQKEGKHLLYVGDGINDAPILKQSDVSISVASGSDLASISSDIIFLDDKMENISECLYLAKIARKKTLQNIIFTIIIKFIITILSFMGYSNMYLSLFSDVGVSLLSIVNALTILKYNYQKKV